MLQNVIILVFTALSSFLWWRSRFKIMSEMSITNKTMGVRLPGLWHGAIRWRKSSR